MKRTKTILIVTPFCNEEHSITQYMESLSNLDYPKRLIDVLWIENNSSDHTWERLQGYAEEFKEKYRSFKLLQISAGFKIPKETYGEYSKTQRGGKVGGTADINIRKMRSELFVSILNYALSLGDENDFTFFLFADCIVQPDIIDVFIEDLENHPKCGWIGGVMHRRYPLHYRKKNTSTFKAGIASPIMKIYDNESPPEDQKEEWIIRQDKLVKDFKRTFKQQKEFFGKYCPEEFPYEYGIYHPTEEEIAEKQKVGDGTFEVSYCGHVWMMPPEVYRAGLRFRIAPLETGIAFGDYMAKKKMTVLCDSNVYIQHISVDGRIYRKDLLGPPRLCQRMIPTLCLDNVGEFYEMIQFEQEREEYESFVEQYRRMSKHIPHRPTCKGEKIRDPMTNDELDSKAWDEKFGKYVKFMLNRKV